MGPERVAHYPGDPGQTHSELGEYMEGDSLDGLGAYLGNGVVSGDWVGKRGFPDPAPGPKIKDSRSPTPKPMSRDPRP
jgi:hypothetical protein